MAIRTGDITTGDAGTIGGQNFAADGHAAATLTAPPSAAAVADGVEDDGLAAAEEAPAEPTVPAGPAMSEEVIALWRSYRAEPESVTLRNKLI